MIKYLYGSMLVTIGSFWSGNSLEILGLLIPLTHTLLSAPLNSSLVISFLSYFHLFVLLTFGEISLTLSYSCSFEVLYIYKS